ncbi:PREDICTED: LEAF RUST 10 DISEASE-RESISTANCE LOCUS RECEPTOR-LIKE PROTEIN KINASE-like 1.1 [Camelina sativa]|uniref:LEAF RUST 10 DISEASE-RESISTANCE LOCUS RECEPTOR-LIKE PROTEIN KINASE-like 1.1 n=1 Tax=Camelina sativa TaxID=90675 RepID=A0ABM0WYD7_CAMSA|nr:PREDICTED: LEAF RUST 10 DISEASE-RESISTANCE LOCUS RECEPTOR-LIKE PROTEIN KINASE-like 1.1 [Camelina sativa]
METVSVLVFFFLLPLVAEAKSTNQTGCELFTCGELDFKFPFFRTDMPSRCGLFKLNCSANVSEIQLVEDGQWYKVKSVSQANTITITDTALKESLKTGNCTDLSRFSLPDSPWLNLPTLYRCNNTSMKNGFTYGNCGGEGSSLYYSNLGDGRDVPGCSAIRTPKSWVNPSKGDKYDVNATFSLYIELPRGCYSCHNRGGECKMNKKNKFHCDGVNKEPKRFNLEMKLGLGIGGFLILIIILVALYIIHRSCRRRKGGPELSRDNSKSDVEFSHVFFKIPIFSYKELQEATNNFSKDRLLGDGGFGTVYYGKVRDGREVAVKRLYEHNYRRLEQFMNEIEILTRLHHKNLVSLYGCTSRRSRELLLVYEYISNGTVADHLYGENPPHQGYLTWSMRMSIAIETASALAYLHASDIIHRDVKTTNILLDGNFGVKVADFGLSRLFPSDVTHVSTAPQGTPGYVDPEYHRCYHLTDKSDVYSFGVVLVELISSKPAVDITRCKSEINLSSLAINKIQNHATHELIDQNLGYATNEEVRKMTTMVAELAFQCLQQDNTMRPTMEQVVQELKEIQNEEQKCQNNDYKEETITTHPSPPDWGENALLKNVKFPRSPISVTDQWTSKSTTPNTSAYEF